MYYLKMAWNFLVKSSADPKQSSLTVRAALLGALTVFSAEIVQALNLVCEFGYRCYYFSPSMIDDIRVLIDQLTYGVYVGLLLLSIGLGIFGAIRKIILTIKGENLALREDI